MKSEYKVKANKGVVKRVVVTPDKHFPLHDQPAINCLKKTIEIWKNIDTDWKKDYEEGNA